MDGRLMVGDRVHVFAPGSWNFVGVVVETENESPVDTPVVRVEADAGTMPTTRAHRYWVKEAHCRKLDG